MELDIIYNGNAFETLKTFTDESINCCVTSPPYYGLRDYGVDGQIGIEETPSEYIKNLVKIFDEVKRVLKKDGTLWINIGDSYCHNVLSHNTKSKKQISKRGSVRNFTPRNFSDINTKTKDLIGIPWMLAFALRDNGWYLRQDIIWHKPNPMPESVRDRCTKSHEYIFLLTKSPKYFFDSDAIKEPAKYAGDDRGSRKDSRRGTSCNSMSGKTGEYRNKRDVWSVTTKPYRGAHFAVFPPDLIEPCILAGCPENGVVLDPFFGSGTVGMVAKKHNRHYIGIDLNNEYCSLAHNRIEVY